MFKRTIIFILQLIVIFIFALFVSINDFDWPGETTVGVEESR